jgi:hypothetical protein
MMKILLITTTPSGFAVHPSGGGELYGMRVGV